MHKRGWLIVAAVLLLAGAPRNEAWASDAGAQTSAHRKASGTTPAHKSTAHASTYERVLLRPALLKAKAPANYKVKFVTTKGDFIVEVTRAWAPNGADRFYNLVKLGFYDGVRFFRAVEGFMVQFGLSSDPAVSGAWYRANIPDDPVVTGNKRGNITFAMAGKNSRTTQVFINYSDKNTRLDAMGFPAFGQVIEGMNVVDSLYKGYGEGAPAGKGPDQSRI